jgi:hypothetical protein
MPDGETSDRRLYRYTTLLLFAGEMPPLYPYECRSLARWQSALYTVGYRRYCAEASGMTLTDWVGSSDEETGEDI